MASLTNEQMYYMLAQQAMRMRDQQQPQVQQSQLPQKEDPPKQAQKKDNQDIIVHTFLGAREIELLIREFNPIKYRDLYAAEWIREIELLGKIHKWNSYHLLLYASMRLSGVAKTWYQYSLEYISDWDDFKLELLSNFPKSIDESSVTARLEASRRRSHDTLEEFFYSTVKLGKSIKLNDEGIKEHLVNGLDNAKNKIILSALGPCSLGEFLQHMQRLEEGSDEAGDDHKNRASCSTPKLRDYGSTEVTRSRFETERSRSYRLERDSIGDKRPRESSSSGPKLKRKCYACGEMNHEAINCPNKKRRKDSETTTAKTNEPQNSASRRQKMCFICRDPKHFAGQCPVAREYKEKSKVKQESTDSTENNGQQSQGRYLRTSSSDANDSGENNLIIDMQLDEDGDIA
ncbi:hypothetical protein DMENIID0001_164280 [Sergentomyia squamirostris]